MDVIYDIILYSRLFSLSANFPEFDEWAHISRKFILGCCMKFNCGLITIVILVEFGMSIIFL